MRRLFVACSNRPDGQWCVGSGSDERSRRARHVDLAGRSTAGLVLATARAALPPAGPPGQAAPARRGKARPMAPRFTRGARIAERDRIAGVMRVLPGFAVFGVPSMARG